MEKSCSLVVHFDKGTPALANEIKEALEGNDVAAKIEALKKAIMLLLNGETIPQLFITIIRYVLPSEDHTVQKLLLLYLEIIDKTDSRGKSEIIEPLIPSILSNLEHRHPFVRRNAVLAVMSVYKLPQGEQLLDSAPEIIEKITDWGEQLQMVVLELIKKVCRTNKAEKGKYIKIIISLLNVPSTAVIYECAGTLVSLSSAPTAIKAAASTYCQLLLSQSDNNVKLIVLDRLNELKSSNRDIMVDMEVVKTQSGEHEKNGEYRQCWCKLYILVPLSSLRWQALLCICWDFLGDTNVASAMDVVVFVREIIETNPKLRISIITRLLDTFYQIRAARVCSCALWIIGEYCLSLSEVESGIATIKQCLGDLPFYTATEEGDGQDTSKAIQQLGQSSALPHPIDNDSYDRVALCIRLLCNTGDEVRKIWLQSCRQSFVKMLADKQRRETEEIKAKAQISNAQPDDLIDFYHLKSRKGMSQLELEDELTGFSDPVYAEAYVTVHHYDIVLDVTVINRTKETLQNLCLELATMGDLKLVERPQNYTLAPESSKQIKANIKVSSTETGVIFGNIVYETSSNVLERTVIVLNDIHIDIMDYISPASCADVAFRTMWAEFEWENKYTHSRGMNYDAKIGTLCLGVITESTDVISIRYYKMRGSFEPHYQVYKYEVPDTTVSPQLFSGKLNKKSFSNADPFCIFALLSALEGDCGFLAANLYAKSVFGEDALVNVSIEKQTDGKLSGYIRIRSKTQGIALSLGDKITLKQKGVA
ncbi:Coatomer beta subunit, C-terminal [Sesbania bispinosa]|nr:Coatomer beta subunit, C-terminal [Sesbania bispinosa]